MKHLLPIIILLYSCSSPQNKIISTEPIHADSITTATKPSHVDSPITATRPNAFQALEKLSTTGDLNGDGQQDTLYQHR